MNTSTQIGIPIYGNMKKLLILCLIPSVPYSHLEKKNKNSCIQQQVSSYFTSLWKSILLGYPLALTHCNNFNFSFNYLKDQHHDKKILKSISRPYLFFLLGLLLVSSYLKFGCLLLNFSL